MIFDNADAKLLEASLNAGLFYAFVSRRYATDAWFVMAVGTNLLHHSTGIKIMWSMDRDEWVRA